MMDAYQICWCTFGQFIWDYLRNFDPLILSLSLCRYRDFRVYFSIDLVVIRVVCRLKTNDAFGGLSWVKIIKIDRFEMAHVHWTYKYVDVARPDSATIQAADQIDLAVRISIFAENVWWCYRGFIVCHKSCACACGVKCVCMCTKIVK